MKVNVVAARSDLRENRIIARLSQALALGAGWGLSSRCDGSAYVNVFVPYLNRVNVRCETRTAAWFTHRDESLPPKVQMWSKAARQVDLRVTSARIYLDDLSQYGPTTLVTPPLDRDKFGLDPGARRRNARPIVGTSGWVYKWGRKGEDLLARLAASELGAGLEWRAAGEGWPVPTKLYDWRDLHQFYQGLDVYVCTSLIEGVGYGPLEALACGCRVVLPSGVGVFDDLAEGPGLRHYQAGDAADLERALALCLEDRAEPEALRQATEPYTFEAWTEGWRKAVGSLVGEKPAVGAASPKQEEERVVVVAKAQPETDPAPPPSWRGRAGLYVVAYGEPSRKAALRCVEAFRRHNPGIPVAACAETPLGVEDVQIAHPEKDIGARYQKVSIYDLAPAQWEYVLYLDADTEPRGSLSALFDWLESGWEWVACLNPGRFAVADQMGRTDNTRECEETFALWGTSQMAQLAGGVFAFHRSPATERFFARWQAEWERYGKRDQGALLRAYWHEPVRTLLLLPRVWNCVAHGVEGKPGKWRYPYDDPRDAAVIHYPVSARRWSGIVADRSDSPAAWQRVREWERAHGQGATRR